MKLVTLKGNLNPSNKNWRAMRQQLLAFPGVHMDRFAFQSLGRSSP
jgi:hypothetical protein